LPPDRDAAFGRVGDIVGPRIEQAPTRVESGHVGTDMQQLSGAANLGATRLAGGQLCAF
jgi:hypothetical protein